MYDNLNTLITQISLFLVLPVIVLLARGNLFKLPPGERNLNSLISNAGFSQDLAVMGLAISACCAVVPSYNRPNGFFQGIGIITFVMNFFILSISAYLRQASSRFIMTFFAYSFACANFVFINFRFHTF